MGLLDELRVSTATPVCSLGRKATGKLTPEDQADLTAALDDDDITTNSLIRALSVRGVIVSKETLRTHRRRHCRCYQ